MGSPRWLNAAEHDAWLALMTTLEMVPAAVDAQLRRDHGVTRFEYYILAMLSDHDTGVRPMTDLSVMTNGSLSRLSHAVEKLEKRGWVRRERLPEDRRTTLVILEDAGRALLEHAAPSHVAEVRRLLFDVIPADKVPLLTDILSPVVARSLGEDGACVGEVPKIAAVEPSGA